MSKKKSKKNEEAKNMNENINENIENIEEQEINNEIIEGDLGDSEELNEQPEEVVEEIIEEPVEEIIEEPVEEIIEEPVEEIAEEETCQVGVVIAERLNVRSNPFKDADVLFVINKGQEVIIDGEDGDFFKVVVDGNVGYCIKNFVAIK